MYCYFWTRPPTHAYIDAFLSIEGDVLTGALCWVETWNPLYNGAWMPLHGPLMWHCPTEYKQVVGQ